MIGTAILLSMPSFAQLSMATILSSIGLYGGGILTVGLCGWKAFMWFFYDRHEGRRVNKRRSA